MVTSFLLISSLLLLASTFIFTVQAYRLKKVTQEYKRSRSLLSDIILSFNDQLRRDESKIEKIERMIESSLKEEKSSEVESTILKLEAEVQNLKNIKDSIVQDISSIKEKISFLEERVGSLGQEIESRKSVEISELEDSIESAIPIKRESVLSSLNETELKVLKFLAEEGKKTALQIRDKFNFSREHSARLLKKLYEKGYLERETSGKPFLYGIKKEMLNLLKSDSQTS